MQEGFLYVVLRQRASPIHSAPLSGALKQIVVAVAQGSTAAMTAFEDIQAASHKKEKEEVTADRKTWAEKQAVAVHSRIIPYETSCHPP
jgi:hypothetical protein